MYNYKFSDHHEEMMTTAFQAAITVGCMRIAGKFTIVGFLKSVLSVFGRINVYITILCFVFYLINFSILIWRVSCYSVLEKNTDGCIICNDDHMHDKFGSHRILQRDVLKIR